MTQCSAQLHCLTRRLSRECASSLGCQPATVKIIVHAQRHYASTLASSPCCPSPLYLSLTRTYSWPCSVISAWALLARTRPGSRITWCRAHVVEACSTFSACCLQSTSAFSTLSPVGASLARRPASPSCMPGRSGSRQSAEQAAVKQRAAAAHPPSPPAPCSTASPPAAAAAAAAVAAAQPAAPAPARGRRPSSTPGVGMSKGRRLSMMCACISAKPGTPIPTEPS